MISLSYLQWSEAMGRVEEQLLNVFVSRDELFIRKLVNASVVRNRLLEHTSNESEDNRQHAIYAKPFQDADLPVYGHEVWRTVFDLCDVGFRIDALFFVWENGRFAEQKFTFYASSETDIAQLLLDHYLVESGRSYEVVYTVFDHERKKALFFLKEVKG